MKKFDTVIMGECPYLCTLHYYYNIPDTYNQLNTTCSTVHCKKIGVYNTPNKVCYGKLYMNTNFGVLYTPPIRVCDAQHLYRCAIHTKCSVLGIAIIVCVAHFIECAQHLHTFFSVPNMHTQFHVHHASTPC